MYVSLFFIWIAFCQDYYSYIIGVDIIMADARDNERRRCRVFLHIAMEGDLNLLICNSVGHARVAVELRKGTGACGRRTVHLAAASGRSVGLILRLHAAAHGYHVRPHLGGGLTPGAW
jgi:hypothetical protein